MRRLDCPTTESTWRNDRERRPVAFGFAWPVVLAAATATALVAAPPIAKPAAGQVATPASLVPDSVPPDTFADARTRALFEVARGRWLEVDQSILSYEAIVRSRFALTLRGLLRDRTLMHAESAARARWSADSTEVVQYLAANAVTPEGRSEAGSILPDFDLWDPTSDQLAFGFGIGSDSDETDESEPPEVDPAATDDDANPGADTADDGDSGSDADIRFELAHPLAGGSEWNYRYQVVDSLQLSLPDGRTIRAVGLELIPRARTSSLVSGVLWIEPESGSVVRALYQLANEFDIEEAMDPDVPLGLIPGILRPLQFDITIIAVEYSLWDFEYWLPARLRIEGFARAGAIRVPGAYDQTYRILDVVGLGDAAAPEDPEAVVERWLEDDFYGPAILVPRGDLGDPYGLEPDRPARGDDDEPEAEPDDDATTEPRSERRRYRLVPEDRETLLTNDDLPPPIWDDAAGFPTQDDLAEFARILAAVGPPDVSRNRFRFDAGPEIGELARYNRVEGFSVGARASFSRATSIGTIGSDLRGWIGIGSGVPDIRLDLWRETPFHRVTLSGYHRVDEVEPRDGNLGVGNSMGALLWGSDDGNYFRASGARLRLEPVGVRRAWYHLNLSAEEHAALPKEVDFTIAGLLGGDDDPFRPGLDAGEGREYAVALGIDPWWGTDPDRLSGGIELLLHGAGGDYEWFRSRLIGRVAVPMPLGLRAGIEVGGGRIWGDAPIQRYWFLGGARTLRGYDSAVAVGEEFLRGRVELARGTGAARISVFSDAGWAGPRGTFDAADALISAGVGLSFLDGLLRFDVVRSIREPDGWGLEVYLDAIL